SALISLRRAGGVNPPVSPDREVKTPRSPEELTDRHGDPLPPGALNRLGTVRFRQGAQVRALAVSPDGKTLASAGGGKVICLWELATGKRIRQWPEPHSPDAVGMTVPQAAEIAQLAFSPDGKLLVTASFFHKRVRLWDAATGKELRHLAGMFFLFAP